MLKRAVRVWTLCLALPALAGAGESLVQRHEATAGEPAQLAMLDQAPVDLVRVVKHERILYLMSGGVPVRAYAIALGDQPEGHKLQEGDERTPEGRYIIDWRNPNSQFYRSLHISYPNEDDRARARALGVDPGGMIMIHGWPNSLGGEEDIARLLYTDWTNGCIALTNTAMKEVWERVPDGTPIEILP